MGYDDYGVGYSAFFAVYFFVIFLIAIAGYVIGSLFMMKVFEKAGVQGKWRAWVPVYSSMVFFKLGDISPWLVFGGLLVWIPFLGWLVGLAMAVLGVLAAWRVGLKLQKEAVWIVLYIFLPIVWLGILAFDKSRWNQNIVPAPWASNGFLRDSTVWEGIPAQTTSVPPAQPGYGAPQGYAAPPQGYAPPQQPGYGAPAAPGAPVPPATPPAAPTAPPAPPAAPPAPPTAPPAAPPAPPAAPPAPPAAPPAPPTGPNQPPA